MKIGFDAKRAFHNFTGLGNYSRFILHALTQHFPDHDYHLFTPTVKSNDETRQLIDNFKIHQAPAILQKPLLKALWRSFLVNNTAKEEKLDIYHGLSNELPAVLPDNIKKVVTIHDLIFLRYPHLFPLIDRKIYKAKFKSACKKADKIVAISQQTKQDIIEFFDIENEKIEVIYQGCHPNFLKSFSNEDLKQIKEKYGLPSEFILNVGTLENRKNALLILKALKAGGINIPVVLVGKGTPYKKELEQYINENNLKNQVIFLHHVAFKDLPGFYDLASLFIYPSIFEGFGIPVIEALHRNLPVITSKGSCFSEAGGKLAIYIDPTNEEELAKAIKIKLKAGKEFTDQQKLTEHLSQFSAKKISSDYIKLYNQLV
ncbi:MAG: glycosyltransferase family 4 protein [Candidatus Cyclobacteriaceae bacterium M2_1C_046]